MSKPSKATQPEPAESWQEEASEPLAPGTVTPVPERDDGDAIGELLGESPAPPEGRRFLTWRRLRWALVILPLIALLVPVSHWMQYQSKHVTSKNAAVRGHLAEIGTRLSGLVSSVNVDVGDRVKAGDLLVQLEDRHLRAEVQEARAEVAGLQRKIEVERMTIGLTRREIGQKEVEAQARVAAAQAQAEAARIEVKDADRNLEMRENLLSRDGAVSIEDVRGAESDRLTARARLVEAQANATVAESAQNQIDLEEAALNIRRKNIGVLESDLARAEARLARAEADLDGAAIRAPEDGAIVRRIIQPGGSVEVGLPIISMWLGQDVWVEAWVDEEDIGFVQLGARAVVTFHSFPDQEFGGTVDKVGLATDLEIPDSEVPQPRFSRMRGAPVVGVRIRLDQPPVDLLPGLSAVVAIEKGH